MNTHEVEQEILNEIETQYGLVTRQKIENRLIEKKRLAMLAAICYKKDAGLVKMIKEIESMSRINQLDKLIERIRKYNPVGEVEKKSFGEIFTPFPLINDMLNTLPIEVWSNPNLKWGDFCNGVGNFMIIVIKRLMIGLETWQPDEDKRYKHIVENMIYVSELQIKNMFLWMVSIDPRSEYKLNLYRGSSLEKDFDEHMKNVWKVEKMDIIVGNPPYNGSQSQKGDKRGGGNSLWDKFVIKSLELLNIDGYLNFVHPSMWRKPISKNSKNKELWDIMTEKQIVYLEIHNSDDGKKVFNAGTRYDWYLIQNRTCDSDTIVIDETGLKNKINLKNWNFLPNKNFDLISKIISGDDKCKLFWNTFYHTATDRYDYVSPKRTDIFNFPIVHSTNKNEVRYFWTNLKNKEHFGVSKVIFGESGINNVIIDIDGDYGTTQGAMSIRFDSIDEAEGLKKCLESKKFKVVLESLSWGNFRIDWRIFTYFRKDFWKDFIDEQNIID